MSQEKITLFWFRRDLRLDDNTGLCYALNDSYPVLPLFIFDTEILEDLEGKKDARVEFIHDQIMHIHEQLKDKGTSLLVKYGKPIEVYKELLDTYNVGAVFTNRDYEPYAIRRDNAVEKLLKEHHIPFYTFKDHVIFEKNEVLTDTGNFYKVFTPYKRRWMDRLNESQLETYTSGLSFENWFATQPLPLPSLKDIGFEPSYIEIPTNFIDENIIEQYDETRDYPALQHGTSRLGIHLRHGTVSIRKLARKAKALNHTYLNELIWRDFYSQILFHYPQVVDTSFKPAYDNIRWRNNEKEFQRWCDGKTGYPIVDAGMRELNATGYMHQRVRMITASFLTKHLLIDWRWGEAYFAKKLLDYELSSNNGGWQWAAGSGTDAQPYFRIFNPHSQAEKFDQDREYIKKWVPECNTNAYPKPIVNHKAARERCLKVYKKALEN